jgi:UPF0042 nucleotide-binding protein
MGNDILIITGFSGAGISSTLKHLEDAGYEVFDNMPLSLVDSILESTNTGQSVAMGIDTRTRGFDPAAILKKVKDKNAKLIFLSCDEIELQKRFTETRRRHPLAKDRPVSAGIQKEQDILSPLMEKADEFIDTSGLSIHDLRRLVDGLFGAESKGRLTVSLMSFGFRYGVPREADIVMDVRFLKNPHWDKDLKPLTGQDKAVGDYINTDENFDPFLTHFKAMIEPLLPRYAHEGKSYLTIAIGCTGGHHRSVYTVEKLSQWLGELSITTHTQHRDIAR